MGKKKKNVEEHTMPAAPTPTPPAPPPKRLRRLKGKRPTQSKLELPPEEFEEVRRIAKETGRSLSAFVKIAVRDMVRRIKKQRGE